LRVAISIIVALVISTSASAQARRLPPLPVGFWRLDGTKMAEEAMSKGDSGLIVLVVPDSTVLAFKRPLNLEMNTLRDLYHIHYGDLGIDSLGLLRYRDSINVFLQAYNFVKMRPALE
jgi:hypothetical protein